MDPREGGARGQERQTRERNIERAGCAAHDSGQVDSGFQSQEGKNRGGHAGGSSCLPTESDRGARDVGRAGGKGESGVGFEGQMQVGVNSDECPVMLREKRWPCALKSHSKPVRRLPTGANLKVPVEGGQSDSDYVDRLRGPHINGWIATNDKIT